jgi:hypothetical protein
MMSSLRSASQSSRGSPNSRLLAAALLLVAMDRHSLFLLLSKPPESRCVKQVPARHR